MLTLRCVKGAQQKLVVEKYFLKRKCQYTTNNIIFGPYFTAKEEDKFMTFICNIRNEDALHYWKLASFLDNCCVGNKNRRFFEIILRENKTDVSDWEANSGIQRKCLALSFYINVFWHQSNKWREFLPCVELQIFPWFKFQLTLNRCSVLLWEGSLLLLKPCMTSTSRLRLKLGFYRLYTLFYFFRNHMRKWLWHQPENDSTCLCWRHCSLVELFKIVYNACYYRN